MNKLFERAVAERASCEILTWHRHDLHTGPEHHIAMQLQATRIYSYCLQV